MENKKIDLINKHATGLAIPTPIAPLVIAYGPKGFVMCGYLDITVANKMGVAAAIVRGVSTVDDLLKASIQVISEEAEKKGVKLGDTGLVALTKLNS